MTPAKFDDRLADYVDVAERITFFREKHAEGSLAAEVVRWPEDGFPFIVVRAKAYRSPDDPRPGVGWAMERWPGGTPYTRDSELQNAETSAWGRAIVAVLAADTKRGIASADEIRNRMANGEHQHSWAQVEGRQIERCLHCGETRKLTAEVGAAVREKTSPPASASPPARRRRKASTPPPEATDQTETGKAPEVEVSEAAVEDPAGGVEPAALAVGVDPPPAWDIAEHAAEIERLCGLIGADTRDKVLRLLGVAPEKMTQAQQERFLPMLEKKVRDKEQRTAHEGIGE